MKPMGSNSFEYRNNDVLNRISKKEFNSQDLIHLQRSKTNANSLIRRKNQKKLNDIFSGGTIDVEPLIAENRKKQLI